MSDILLSLFLVLVEVNCSAQSCVTTGFQWELIRKAASSSERRVERDIESEESCLTVEHKELTRTRSQFADWATSAPTIRSPPLPRIRKRSYNEDNFEM